MTPAQITLIILAIAIVSFVWEKIPVPLTAMLAMTALVLLKIIKPAQAIAGFSNTTVILFTAMVVVGGGIFETGVSDKVARLVTKFAKTERQILIALFLVGTLMSAALNNTGTTAIFIPIIMGLAVSTGFSRSKMLMAMFLGVMSGGRLTLIGDATVNTIAQAAIVENGGVFEFFDIGKIGLPLTLLALIWLYFVGSKALPDKEPPANETNIFTGRERREAPMWKQVFSVAVLAFVFIGMIFTKEIGLPLYMIALLAGVALSAAGILRGKQVYDLIDMKTIFLYVGMLPLGAALKSTGAAQIIADAMIKLIGGSTNVYLITAITFAVACFMTQFMSNVVAITLLCPIVVAVAKTIGASPTALIATACIASTMGLVSPIACPPANIIYGYGGYKFTDYFKSNWSLVLLSLAMCVVFCPMIWPLY